MNNGVIYMVNPTFSEYSDKLHGLISSVEVTGESGKALSVEDGVQQAVQIILSKKADGKKIIVIGNGGSAAIASHMQNDLCKAVTTRSLVFNEAPLLSALSNDLAYSVAFEYLINLWADAGDLLIAISSSGQSENIIRAADAAIMKGSSVVTLSGFKNDNPLRLKGVVNFYVPSGNYGYVELGHSIITHYITDSAQE